MTRNLISLSEGAEMTARYRAEKENILEPDNRGSGMLPICESFDRDVFDLLLAVDGCTGIRVYCGMDKTLKVRMIICGVTAQGDDIYLPPAHASEEFNVIDQGIRCPEDCPPASTLNS